ncbi:MAG: MerC domain-containing protein [Lentisphaeria bacterium]
MKMQKSITVLSLSVVLFSMHLFAAPSTPDIEIENMRIDGTIEKKNIAFTLSFEATCRKANSELALITGNMVLKELPESVADKVSLRYDSKSHFYYMLFRHKGEFDINVTFAARPDAVQNNKWRQAVFSIPSSPVRELNVSSDRTDLEVKFPGALRVQRNVSDGVLTLTALQGPDKPFAIQWKPQVAEMEGKLVVASRTNTIANIRAGALRLDNLVIFEVAQGKLRKVRFQVPQELNITQVRCPFIQDWRIKAAGGEDDGKRLLEVFLNRPITGEQPIQIMAEKNLPQFPAEISLPVIQPLDVIRATGHLMVGTDSAVQLLVEQTGNLSQVERAAFPRMVLDRAHPRPLPEAKAFYYQYAATPYRMKLKLDDIVPSYDAAHRISVNVKEDDMTVNAQIELDVRDAPLRKATIMVDRNLVVAGVESRYLDEYNVLPPKSENAPYQNVEVRFAQPVQGRTLIKLDTELGKGPLNDPQKLRGFNVVGAKNQRGYLVISAEKGVQIAQVENIDLRKVHTSSVAVKAPDAQYAYRFRKSSWQLTLTAGKKAAAILAEPFHLVSIGEGIMYGSVVVNYFISGAPVDQFRFSLPEQCRNVEFIGSDVRNWKREKNTWTVNLQRKVIGEYNLGVSYNQRYEAGETVLVGGVACEDVETQSGFMAVTSPLNLNLDTVSSDKDHVLAVEREEIPANYRTMTRHPILGSYKYVRAPHRIELRVSPYERGDVIPVLVEVMDLKTEMTVNEMGKAESVTRIFYKVKNSSRQYISLEMPENTSYAVARLIKADNHDQPVTKNSGEAINAQLDHKTGMLMIPLPRRQNLNSPITFQLEYGQTHGKVGMLDEIDLRAPRTPLHSTFAEWEVTPPAEFRLRPGKDSNMIAENAPASAGGLGNVARRTASSWLWLLENFAQAGLRLPEITIAVFSVFALVAAGLLVTAILFARRFIFPLLITGGLLILSGMGVLATKAPDFVEGSLRQSVPINFQQALDLNESPGLRIAVKVIPGWLQAPPAWLAVSAAIAILSLIWAWRGKHKMFPAAVGIWALLYLVAGFAFGGELVAHLFTWGIPLALFALCIKLCIKGTGKEAATQPGGAPAAAMIVLACLLLPSTAHRADAMGGARITVPGYETVIQNIDCEMTAEKDSILTEMHVQFRTIKPFTRQLLTADAILLSDPDISDHITLYRTKEGYTMEVAKAGNYDISIKYLTPLPPANEQSRVRRFHMPIPEALANRVSLTIPETGLDVESSTAVELNRREDDAETRVNALFAPGEPVTFAWKPRTRKTELEKTTFFTRVINLLKFDAGLAEGRHLIRFQVAQGELSAIRIKLPENMTVTSVSGRDIGAWRFEPDTQELEIKLSKASTVEYELTVVTQISRKKMPYQAIIQPLTVRQTNQQRGVSGIAMTPAVYGTIEQHPRKINLEDFVRDAAALLKKSPGLQASDIRSAYRIRSPEDKLEVTVHAVQPEIRTFEKSVFSVGDERLAYSSSFQINIDKTGVFSVNLQVPDGYDIDTLNSPQVSHWDEMDVEGRRLIKIHFKSKLLGRADLNLALSRPVAELPGTVAVPRLAVKESVKHSGNIVISSERGVRLAAAGAKRRGVSEIDPAEMGIRDRNALAYKLLKPDWDLSLETEVIEPRINVDFLHVARVSEGRIQHNHTLRYRFFNAGTKYFTIRAPSEAIGLQIRGPAIARIKNLDAAENLWQVELSKKWFDRPYNLNVSYETQYDRTAGKVVIPHIQATEADLQRGHIVVFANERVELSATEIGNSLQRADARNLPAYFRQGDLSGAAFCYRSTEPVYNLTFKAIRHEAADLLEAEVLNTTIRTIASDRGETINQVDMNLRVGDKRHLAVRLPEGSEMWSLIVNGAATVPSTRKTETGEEVILIPLDQTASGEMAVNLEFIFVVPPLPDWQTEHQGYSGPRFDVPLKDITWEIYVPDNMNYYNMKGSLNADRKTTESAFTKGYGISSYEQQIESRRRGYLQKGKELQHKGQQLAAAGKVSEAKQLLEWSANYSRGDRAQNEDARVQLRNLMQQQSVAGLINRRDQLRQQKPGTQAQTAKAPVQQEQAYYNQQELQRIQASLSREDSANLQRIITQLLENQEAAVSSMAQFAIALPVRGRLLRFKRPLQVEVNAPMKVSFEATPTASRIAGPNWGWVVAPLVGIFVLSRIIPRLLRRATPNPKPEKSEISSAAVNDEAISETGDSSDACEEPEIQTRET